MAEEGNPALKKRSGLIMSVLKTVQYIVASLMPMIIAVLAYEIIGYFVSTEHEPFIIAGLTGSVSFGVLFLKRSHDVKIVRNAFKADLECFSDALNRLIVSLPEGDERNSQKGVVNITSFSHMDVYNKFIDKVTLLDIKTAKRILEVYAQLKIFIPASTLISGVDQKNEHQLVVSSEGYSTLKRTAVFQKAEVDAILNELKKWAM